MNSNTPIKQRLYITFGKFDSLIYISNLDVAKLWERVLRRVNLPILYSEGFNPRPRIALATALPLGISSECEILDVSLREPIELDGLQDRIVQASPPGLRVYDITEVPVRSPALTARARSAEYRITFDEPIDYDDLRVRLADLLGAEERSYARDRKGKSKTVNIRPLVHSLELDASGALLAHLAIGETGNLRPEEILAELGLSDVSVTVHRYRLHIDPSLRQYEQYTDNTT